MTISDEFEDAARRRDQLHKVFLKKWTAYETGEIRLSAKDFLHLKALINAFDVADEPDAKSIEIDVSGLGVISWSHGQDVLINLETVKIPNAKTQ